MQSERHSHIEVVHVRARATIVSLFAVEYARCCDITQVYAYQNCSHSERTVSS